LSGDQEIGYPASSQYPVYKIGVKQVSLKIQTFHEKSIPFLQSFCQVFSPRISSR
jgi:hypothetical protein